MEMATVIDERPNGLRSLASDMPAEMEHDWYVLLIEPQQEVRVEMALRSYRVRSYLPIVPCIATRGARRTKVTVYRPMMRGYLFVREDSVEDLLRVRRPLPIHGFLRFGERIAVATQKEINRVANNEEELAKPKSIKSIWSVGETVRIGDGPFWGLNAVITDLANGTRITIEVGLLGRKVPMHIDEYALEKL